MKRGTFKNSNVGRIGYCGQVASYICHGGRWWEPTATVKTANRRVRREGKAICREYA